MADDAILLLGTLLVCASLVAAVAAIEDVVKNWLHWRKVQR